MRLLGIDPGLSKTCGWAVGEKRGDGLILLDYAVEVPSRIGLRVLASKLSSIAERYGVDHVLIEDFFFLGKRKQNQNGHAPEEDKKDLASRYVVERMQRLIGYLEGFFSARYVPVRVVHPAVWKNRIRRAKGVESPDEFLLKLYPELEGLPKAKRKHVLSAVGLIMAEMGVPL